MVSLRSGKRISRPSPSTAESTPKQKLDVPTVTPKRTRSSIKKVELPAESSSETLVPTKNSKKIMETLKNSAKTPIKLTKALKSLETPDIHTDFPKIRSRSPKTPQKPHKTTEIIEKAMKTPEKKSQNFDDGSEEVVVSDNEEPIKIMHINDELDDKYASDSTASFKGIADDDESVETPQKNRGSPSNKADIEDKSDCESDDDEPMEISSKIPEIPFKNVETYPNDSDGDDNDPIEATSKTPEVVEEPKSVIEKLLEKKAAKSAKIAAKNLKKRSKKKEAKKIADGVFEVKMKKSKAKFNVVTLKSGVQNILEPEVNFREELLKSRTAGTRLPNTEKFQQRRKWVSNR